MSYPVIREYLRAAVGDDPTGPADTELLARFVTTRDESAFELLVWRHAALVQRVCRSVLEAITMLPRMRAGCLSDPGP